MKKKTRREFLIELISYFSGILGIKLLNPKTSFNIKSSLPKSKVILSQSNKAFSDSFDVNINILKEMITNSIKLLTNSNSALSAWKSLFSPEDIVAIKVNTLSGKFLSSHPELVEVLVDRLKLSGVKEENIIIYDRTNAELKRAGFKINLEGRGAKCFGTDTPGVGYDNEPTVIGSVGSCFSRIVSEFCTAIINVPVLKDHDLAGVSIALKNHFGSINNPNKCHPNNCDPYIADLNLHSFIKDKTRLIICDALLASYDDGPAYTSDGTWKFNSILVSFDPVALDYIGLLEIEKKRKERGLPPLKSQGRYPKYIDTAADKEHRLGVNKLEKIDLIKIKT